MTLATAIITHLEAQPGIMALLRGGVWPVLPMRNVEGSERAYDEADRLMPCAVVTVGGMRPALAVGGGGVPGAYEREVIVWLYEPYPSRLILDATWPLIIAILDGMHFITDDGHGVLLCTGTLGDAPMDPALHASVEQVLFTAGSFVGGRA